MKHNPYVGPRPYERQDRQNFYGRDVEARELRSLILSEREVLFYAQSGAGKTSLLNAKVIPMLEEEGFCVLPVARVGSELPPGSDAAAVPNVFVFSVLLSLAGEDADPNRLLHHTLHSFLVERFAGAGRPAVDDEVLGTAEFRPLVLILDQLEEVFTTHRDRWQEAEGFFRQVREALDALPELGVVLAMREDHVAAIDPYAPIFPRRLKARFRMERLGPRGALAAVKQPAENAGCRYAPGVAEQLVDNLRQVKVQRQAGEETVLGPFVEPVQLQVVCNQLWANLPEQEDTTIQWEEVEQYGNIDRALTDFYESTLRKACEETGVSERKLRRWFGEHLITPVGTRGLVLRGPEASGGLPNAAVDVLERQHCIRADVRAGARWYELSHDRLVEPILQSNRAWAAARETPLRTTARRWQETGSAALLYAGAALKEAAVWADAHADGVEEYEAEFLKASREAEQARLRRRNWLIAGGVIAAVILVALAGLTRWALNEREKAQQQTRLALSRQWAAQSAGELDKPDYEVALLLAIEALDQQTTAEAVEALYRAFVQPGATLRILSGHAAEVSWGAWNADESRLVTASFDGTARVWDAATGRSLLLLSGHTGTIWQAVWSKDGRSILTAGGDGTARIWDVATALAAGAEKVEARLILSGHTDGVTQAVWNADESRILTVSNDGTARVWDASTGTGLFTLSGHTGPVLEAVWNGDESLILTSGSDGTARVWDGATGKELSMLSGHMAEISHAVWNADESRILTSSWDGTAKVWSAATGEELLTLPGEMPFLHAAWNAEGSRILTVSLDGAVVVWDASTGEPLLTLSGATGALLHAAWNADGSRILASSFDGTARIWDVATPLATGAETAEPLLALSGHTLPIRRAIWNGTEDRVLTVSDDATARIWDVSAALASNAGASGSPFILAGHVGVLSQAVWSRDESRILTAGEDGTARVWDAQTGRGLLVLSYPAAVLYAVWNGDESRILTADSEGAARVWDAKTGEALLTLSGHTDAIWQARWNADENRILTAGRDDTARVWDAATGEELLVLSGHTDGIRQAIWNRDESRILTTGQDRTARVWDAETGEELLTLSGHVGVVHQALWNADESRILTSSWDGTARVWDAETGQGLLTLSAEINHAIWSRDERRILTAGDDGTIRIWDAKTGKGLLTLSGHRGSVWQAVWNADESRILSAGDDGTARIWDASASLSTGAATGEALLTLAGHTDRIRQARWSRDESLILTAGDDGTARVWYSRVEDLRRVACERAPRNLALGEWQRYFDTPYRATCETLPPHATMIEDRIRQAEQLSRVGDDRAAAEAYRQALTWVQEVDAPALYDGLCRSGGVYGAADVVMPACERAVELLPHYPGYHRNRGMARAATGDLDGAAEDFEASLELMGGRPACGEDAACLESIATWEAWIAELKAGRNPIDEGVLERIRE